MNYINFARKDNGEMRKMNDKKNSLEDVFLK